MREQEQGRGIEELPFKNTLNGKTRDYAEEKQHAAPKEGYHAPVFLRIRRRCRASFGLLALYALGFQSLDDRAEVSQRRRHRRRGVIYRSRAVVEQLRACILGYETPGSDAVERLFAQLGTKLLIPGFLDNFPADGSDMLRVLLRHAKQGEKPDERTAVVTGPGGQAESD